MASKKPLAEAVEQPPAKPPTEDTHQCEGPECAVMFVPKRSTARYHSATCRQRAGRARKAAAAAKAPDETPGEKADRDRADEHPLVKAVLDELTKADKHQSFNGQLALQLARKLVSPEESGATALSKELRTVMATALATQTDAVAPAPEPEADEVERARVRRVEKARKAAEST